jgi:hypothetical protein
MRRVSHEQAAKAALSGSLCQSDKSGTAVTRTYTMKRLSDVPGICRSCSPGESYDTPCQRCRRQHEVGRHQRLPPEDVQTPASRPQLHAAVHAMPAGRSTCYHRGHSQYRKHWLLGLCSTLHEQSPVNGVPRAPPLPQAAWLVVLRVYTAGKRCSVTAKVSGAEQHSRLLKRIA